MCGPTGSVQKPRGVKWRLPAGAPAPDWVSARESLVEKLPLKKNRGDFGCLRHRLGYKGGIAGYETCPQAASVY